MTEIDDARIEHVNPGHRAEKRVPVLYLDLDGTVRWGLDELGRFVNGPEDVHIFDGVAARLAGYRVAGWRVVGISNQGGIALGHVSARAVAEAMAETHRQTNELFDKLVWCSHHPDAADPEMAVCWCRKPRAGMIFEAAFDMASLTEAAARRMPLTHSPEIYPPHMALMVGDRDEDRGCAEAANIRFMDAREWREGGHVFE